MTDENGLDLAKYLPTAGEWYSVMVQGKRDETGKLIIDEVRVSRLDEDGNVREKKP